MEIMSKRRQFKQHAEGIAAAFFSPLLIPYALTDQKAVIALDVTRWSKELDRPDRNAIVEMLRLLVGYPEFRTLFYHRMRCGNLAGSLLSIAAKLIYRGRTALYLNCPDIGPGLFLQHAWSTGVGAKSIGKNCWINQQVTIGHTDRSHGPIIGDNVFIHAGAKVLGPIRIGDNVKIGANALVLKDIPDNSVVIGALPSVLRRSEKKPAASAESKEVTGELTAAK